MSVNSKIEKLIEESRSNDEAQAEINSSDLDAATFAKMTPDEQSRILSGSHLTKKGMLGLGGALGHGALLGGLVGGGTALANQFAGTNFDPVLSGLGTAGLTSLFNAPGSYSEGKREAEDFQNDVRYAQDTNVLNKNEKTFNSAMKKGGFNKADIADIIADRRNEVL